LESAAASIIQGQPSEGVTHLFILPGYRFQLIDGMLTNFHLPRSTLLALVGAFCGLDVIMDAYQEAIRQQYRFYSYGDCMLLL
jgi:S-adenosylmethionine:tRNA ribosyltransferase-isomerase